MTHEEAYKLLPSYLSNPASIPATEHEAVATALLCSLTEDMPDDDFAQRVALLPHIDQPYRAISCFYLFNLYAGMPADIIRRCLNTSLANYVSESVSFLDIDPAKPSQSADFYQSVARIRLALDSIPTTRRSAAFSVNAVLHNPDRPSLETVTHALSSVNDMFGVLVATQGKWPDMLAEIPEDAYARLWTVAHDESPHNAILMHLAILEQTPLGVALASHGLTTGNIAAGTALHKFLAAASAPAAPFSWQEVLSHRPTPEIIPETLCGHFRVKYSPRSLASTLLALPLTQARSIARCVSPATLRRALELLEVPTSPIDALATRLYRSSLALNVAGCESMVASDLETLPSLLAEIDAPWLTVATTRALARPFHCYYLDATYCKLSDVARQAAPSELTSFGIEDCIAHLRLNGSSVVSPLVLDSLERAFPATALLQSTGLASATDTPVPEIAATLEGTYARVAFHQAALTLRPDAYPTTTTRAKLPALMLARTIDLPDVSLERVYALMPRLKETLDKYPSASLIAPAAISYLIATRRWALCDQDIHGLSERQLLTLLFRSALATAPRAGNPSAPEIAPGMMVWLTEDKDVGATAADASARDDENIAEDQDEDLDEDQDEDQDEDLDMEDAELSQVDAQQDTAPTEEFAPWAADPFKDAIILEHMSSVDTSDPGGENETTSQLSVFYKQTDLEVLQDNDPSLDREELVLHLYIMGPALTPELARKLKNPSIKAAFEQSARLGVELSLAFLKNPDPVFRAIAYKMADDQAVDLTDTKDARASRREKCLKSLLTRPRRASQLMEQCVDNIKDAMRSAPDLFSSSMSFTRAMAITQDWHEQFGQITATEAADRAWITYAAFPRPLLAGYVDDRVQLVHLADSVQIAEEGAMMRSCVGTYSHKARRGECTLYSVRSNTGARLATLELDNKGEIRQLFGNNNAQVPSHVTVWLNPLIEQLVHDTKRRRHLSRISTAPLATDTLDVAIRKYLVNAANSALPLSTIAADLASVPEPLRQTSLHWLASLARHRTSAADQTWLASMGPFPGRVTDIRSTTRDKALELLKTSGLEAARGYVAATLPCEPYIFDALLVSRTKDKPVLYDTLIAQSADLALVASNPAAARSVQLINQYAPPPATKIVDIAPIRAKFKSCLASTQSPGPRAGKRPKAKIA